MRVLVVTTRSYRNLHGGDSQRIYHVCRHLSDVGDHSLDLMTLTGTGICEEFRGLADKIYEIRGNPIYNAIINLFHILFKGSPITSAIYQSNKYKTILGDIINDYDLVVFHLVRSFPFNLPNYSGKVIVEATDLISKNYQKFFEMSWLRKILNVKAVIFSLDYKRYENLERHVVDKVDKFVLVNDRDLNIFFRSKSNVKILKNGRSKLSVQNESLPTCDINTLSKSLLFIGNLKSEQNWLGLESFYNGCFMSSRLQDVNLIVAGNIPSYRRKVLEKWERTSLKSNYASINDLYVSAAIGIAPIFIGAGLQNKILDYAELGIPIITTSLAASAFDFSEELYVCDDLEKWDNLILSVLNSKSVKRVSKQSLVKYDWDSTLRGYSD